MPVAEADAGPDRPLARRTGRSDRIGRPWRAARAQRAAFRDALAASAPQQDAAARGSKGDASLPARGFDSPAPGADDVRDSAAGAARACDAPGDCSGSAARQDAANVAAPSRRSFWSNRCCRDRSAGREQPDDGTKRSCTGGRCSSSQRPMRTGWTRAQTRTIVRIWAVPGMARGVRRRLLPASEQGRRRIVLRRPSLLPPLSLSGPQDPRRRRARRHRNRSARPLWISSPPPPDSRRSLRRATYPQLHRETPPTPTRWLQRHRPHSTK